MLVLAFAFSPKKDGNTEILLNEVIEGLRQEESVVEKYRTHDLNITPCTGCGGCEVTGRCVINDEFQSLYDKLISCDGVVISSPLYFMNVPARGKALIDRCQSFWSAKYRLGLDLFGGRERPGLVLACSGARSGLGGTPLYRGFEDTMATVFDVLSLFKYESILLKGIDKKGDVKNDSPTLIRARKIGIEMAQTMRKTTN